MPEHLVFIVDMNELEDNEFLVVSMDFTTTYGPFILQDRPQPVPGEWVRLHYDEEDTLYYGEVIERLSDRDLRVRIDWDSATPVLNSEWSSGVATRSGSYAHALGSQTAAGTAL